MSSQHICKKSIDRLNGQLKRINFNNNEKSTNQQGYLGEEKFEI